MKRATSNNYTGYKYANIISIHALVKRATYRKNGKRQQTHYFNPRPREKGDILTAGDVPEEINISIHALVKRATVFRQKRLT